MTEQTKNDGGPAFPQGVDSPYSTETGMSLRDWFAGMALQGMITSNTEGLKAPDYWSRMAYNIADSMLTERSK